MPPASDDELRELRAELAARAADFHRIDRALGPNDDTTDEWMLAAIRRDDAMRAVREIAPDDDLLAREDHARAISEADAWLKLGRERIARLAGRLLARGFGGRETLGLCLDHNAAHYRLSEQEVERVVEWIADRELRKLRGQR